MRSACLLTLALLTASNAYPDPRVPLVELQSKGQYEVALAEVERLLATDREAAKSMGLDYLRGRLLEKLGRTDAAADAFLTAVARTPRFEVYSYYRLALDKERLGHPEMAAALVARVLAAEPPFPELDRAAWLLHRLIGKGGECRLLLGLADGRLAELARRIVRLTRAECAVRAGDLVSARALVTSLLADTQEDEPAFAAARLAEARLLKPQDPELARQVGLTLHLHREFERSSAVLDPVLTPIPLRGRLTPAAYRLHYARARNDFWLRQHASAIAAFGRLAEAAPDASAKANCYYQQGRTHELANNGTLASASYRRAFMAEPNGEWGSVSLLAALRVEWMGGSAESALELLGRLRAQRSAEDYLARAVLFLAASDLVRARTDRAAAWLTEAERSGEASLAEIQYWRGRLAEATSARDAALESYLRVLRADLFNPFAVEAQQRLRRPELAAAAQDLGTRRATSRVASDLYDAWLLLGPTHPKGELALSLLAAQLGRDPGAATFLRLAEVPVAEWRLWREAPAGTEDQLLRLGLFYEGADAVESGFPLSQPSLALTGARQLVRGGKVREGLRTAEILAARVPARVPSVLLPRPFAELLHPLPWRSVFLGEAHLTGVAPALLAAITREESRFDTFALSNASARGLMQVTQPLLRQLAPRLKRAIQADDLYQPEVGIGVGALYLSDLSKLFPGNEPAVVAAYNAGEDQVRLWLGYCYSRDPAELYSKVGFRQTRNYVLKVLTSRNRYQSLYWGPASAPAPPTSAPRGSR
jgi:soluble lytic murein transglycosylase